MSSHIIAGGGGFSLDADNLVLDHYVVERTGSARPTVCFLAQASGENPGYVADFVTAFESLGARPTHLSLFNPHTADLESFLAEQDVIYVGGGNTKTMLAIWREWGLPDILRRVNEAGVILAGLSAGTICWFERGLTDSVPGTLTDLECLGLLEGSCAPHYDGDPRRRPAVHAAIESGTLMAGYGIDDGASAYFVDGVLQECVSSRGSAAVYRIARVDGSVVERTLPTRYLEPL